MTYRVVITSDALSQASDWLKYLADEKQAPEVASCWWDKALAEVLSLQTFPRRCPLAPENQSSERELRVLVVDQCLFIYHVNDDQQVVRVVRFRHGSQEPRPLQ